MKFKMLVSCLLFWGTSLGHADPMNRDEPNGDNVFIITLDGFRWQELYGGADSTLLFNPSFSGDTSFGKAMYWNADINQRREKLMPFFWNVLAKKGQLYGNRELGSKVNTKNIYFLSYPGYNEIFTGEADPLVATNRKVKNHNKNLLEYINKIPGYEGRVAAFTSWDAFPYILNRDRSKLYINAGHETVNEEHLSDIQLALNKIEINPEQAQEATRNDMITYLSAKEFIRKKQPKVMFLGLSGTDDAGHNKRYDEYLKSANEADRIISDLWNTVQSMPQYKDRTTFIITTDHGRGNNQETWYNHGFFVKGSSQTWIAMLGNGVKPLGEVSKGPQLYQKNIAGTISYLLGLSSFAKNKLPETCFTKTAEKSLAVYR